MNQDKALGKKEARNVLEKKIKCGKGILNIFLLSVLIFLGGMLAFIPGQAKASAQHPLLNDYDELKAGYPFINNLLATQGATGVSDELIKVWLSDVELELDNQIFNQSTNLADKDKLISIVQETFEPNIISFNPPKVEADKNKEVFNALIAVYGKEIYDCIMGGEDLPQDVKDLLNHIKEILINYMIIAEPPAGGYKSPLEVALSSFTEGASIFYTLDGSNPTVYSNKYLQQLVFECKDSPVLLKAIASKNGENSETKMFNYQILDKPSVPVLKAPSNGSTVDKLTPVLEWNAVAGESVTYAVQVGTSSSFSASTLAANVTGLSSTNYTCSKLQSNKTYYWRVNAANELGVSKWSSVWRFKTPAGL